MYAYILVTYNKYSVNLLLLILIKYYKQYICYTGQKHSSDVKRRQTQYDAAFSALLNDALIAAAGLKGNLREEKTQSLLNQPAPSIFDVGSPLQPEVSHLQQPLPSHEQKKQSVIGVTQAIIKNPVKLSKQHRTENYEHEEEVIHILLFLFLNYLRNILDQ